MFKNFLIIALVLFSSFSYASSMNVNLDTRQMTEEEQVALASKLIEMRNTSNISNPKKVSEWVEVGKNIGDAIIGAADKLGVASDKFMQTDTGKLLVYIIIFKTFGNAGIHIFFGLLLLIIFVPTWIYFFRKMCVFKKITYTPVPEQVRLKKTVEYYTEGEVDGTRAIFLLTIAIGITAIMIAIFNY